MTDWVIQDERVCKDSHHFIKLYYDVMDRKRERAIFLYTEEEPVIIWNGNCLQGTDDIARFLANLPLTRHEIVSLDAQKIPMEANGVPEMFVLLVAGSITIKETVHSFTETFTLVMEHSTHKVKSHRFRYVD